jgi:hypothetical protein
MKRFISHKGGQHDEPASFPDEESKVLLKPPHSVL